ncbi:hypothetical protein BC936DRAFT_143363 [Jimgerdemannia flammicorona]|uniref:Protein kinase domain-containing protein n=1 Tax=Jimgerdemannia flammicorona TaxID=994334 RepID=A0A432ZZH1_9FUNG|nr:hypothetical protein BC936DRAFT_143363 [Jimgerdemannia flammicorona]
MTTCYRTNMKNFVEHSQRPRDVFIGTPLFASVAAMNKLEHFYLDDLESLGYILLYIVLKRHLPWENSKDREVLRQKKQIMTVLGNAKNDKQYQKALLEIVIRYFSYLSTKQWAWRPKDVDYEELKAFLSGSKELAAASRADPIIVKRPEPSIIPQQMHTYNLRSQCRQQKSSRK